MREQTTNIKSIKDNENTENKLNIMKIPKLLQNDSTPSLHFFDPMEFVLDPLAFEPDPMDVEVEVGFEAYIGDFLSIDR